MASADEHIIRVRVQIGIKLRVRKGAGVYICGAVPAIQQIGSAVGQRRGMIMPCIRNPHKRGSRVDHKRKCRRAVGHLMCGRYGGGCVCRCFSSELPRQTVQGHIINIVARIRKIGSRCPYRVLR